MSNNLTRSEKREQVFILLYERDFHDDKIAEEVYAAALESRDIPDVKYIRETYYGACSKTKEIDALVEGVSNRWKVRRMRAITRAILRLCIYEMKYTDVPPRAAINEAVELAKKYDDESAPAFINGILNRCARDMGVIKDSATGDDTADIEVQDTAAAESEEK